MSFGVSVDRKWPWVAPCLGGGGDGILIKVVLRYPLDTLLLVEEPSKMSASMPSSSLPPARAPSVLSSAASAPAALSGGVSGSFAPLRRTDSGNHTLRASALGAALFEHRAEAAALVASRASSAASAASALPSCELPAGCVFVGHLATDMDSIGSAVGAAELFGGVAARASDINTETAYALERFGVPLPAPFAEVGAGRPVVLVDHNQVSQMTAGVEARRVVGIIDHHAMQKGTLVTDVPIYVDIRPWGSACTIVAHSFVAQHRTMSAPTAGLLLCGILSDTLNLVGPTTTRFDRLLAALLAETAGVEDANALAKGLFRAKARMLETLSPHQLVLGDNKTFECACAVPVDDDAAAAAATASVAADGASTATAPPPPPPQATMVVSFGVIETSEPAAVLAHEAELLMELRAIKAEKRHDLAFLAVVDIVGITSTLFLCGRDEEALATAVFGGALNAARTRMDLGARVSRKAQFMPPISQKIKEGGWQRADGHGGAPPPPSAPEVFGEVVHECGPRGCSLRRMPSKPA